MAEINNRFRVKKGLEVQGDSSLSGNLDVTGVITVPTLADSDNSTKAATTQFVRTAIANLIASSPAALDTLNELAAALGDDPNFATTMTNALALKAPLASPALTGSPTAPTAITADSSTLLATTQFVKNQAYATLASPALSGIPTSPTAAPDTNTTQIATAAFVLAQAGAANPLMNGAVSVGTSYRYSRQDHVHPIDTSRAPLNSPGLTGTPTAPTPAFGDNSVNISTTQFVQAALSATGIGYDAAVIPGGATASIDTATIPTGVYVVSATNTGTKPTGDTSGFLIISRASTTAHQLYMDDGTARMWSRNYVSSAWTAWREVVYTDSPALTGVPTAPTAAANTNSTQIATTAYADAIAALKANIAAPSFTGTATFGGSIVTTGSVSSSDYTTITIPQGGAYVSSAASVTGAIKIKLPVLYNTTSVCFDIDVFESTTDAAFKMRVSGYNRLSDTSWQFATAYLMGGVSSRIPKVRFGNDGTACCVWIGDVTDVWATPNVNITNVHIGYSAPSVSWIGAWALSFATTLDTVKLGPITPQKFAGLASPAFTGRLTVNTTDDGTNALQVVGGVRASNYYINAQSAGDAGTVGFGNSNGPGVVFFGSGTGGAGMLQFVTGGAERARFVSNGRFLVNTTTDDGRSQVQVNGAVKVGSYTQTVEIGGDSYTSYNAYYDGSNWQRIDTTKVAWLFQVNVTNNMTFESYKGLSTWVCQPAANPIGAFGTVAGWTLVQSYSQYHDVTYGGNGFEVDGNGTTPYGRFQHATVGGLKRTGIMTNVYVDESGRDDTTKNAWWFGISDDGSASGDKWKIQRQASGGSSVVWTDLATVTSQGRVLLGNQTDDGTSQLQVNGIATATTPPVGDVSTKVATTAFAQSAADNSAIVYAIVFG